MADIPQIPNPDDDEWISALNAPEQAQGPKAELARALIAAMRESGESLAPSDAACREQWQRIAAEMAERNGTKPRNPWWRALFSPPALAWGAATALLLLGLATWLRFPSEPEFDIVAMRGNAQRIEIDDFAAPEPALVAELRRLGVDVALERGADGLRLSAQIPTPPPAGLDGWLQRWKVRVSAGSALFLVLVPAPAQ